ncbi:cysteine desulfurase [bacterium LRH843]|nr:cysteine desulfurase [bacterium LRH843]
METIYVDHAATSPMHPDVVEAMLPYFQMNFGNPSSIHQSGRKARQALDAARTQIANSLSVSEKSIIFTSGGTEADNLAILGYTAMHAEKGNHVITSQIEHHAVLHACKELESRGYEVTYLPVDEYGRVDIEDVRAALREDTILVTIMFGNNEVGTLQPIKEIGELLRGHQAAFHTDAVQACGAVLVKPDDLHVDLLSISAHKINGPKGTGLLYVREDMILYPIFYGGEQERKRRAGTENVAAIVGFAKAIQLAMEKMEKRKERYEQFARILIDTLVKEEVSFYINGHETHRLPHIVNISFPGVNVESLLMNLDMLGIAVSSGSACTAGSTKPSHVLIAMFGETSERISSAIRFSFGLGNTEEEVKQLAARTAAIVKRLQNQQGFIS